jgi:mycothiol synthase
VSTSVVRVCRVGFRTGTDAELSALHAVEAPVDAERRPGRVPQPLESYIAFARSLPSQFDDHAWLVKASDGTPIASGFCWSNAAGDPRVMQCDLFVRRDRRREGIGSQLFATICEEAASAGRTLLTWSTFDAVPAGKPFARRLGACAARINRTSELVLSDDSPPMLVDWMLAERARALGYSLEIVDGAFPVHLRADAATLHHVMQTAPRDDLDIGDVIVDEDFIAELDRHLVEAGRTRWTVFVRDPEGACVGGTEVTFEPWQAATVLQGNTGIDAQHRGLGLAKWAKAAMLERIRREWPQAERIRTDNAFSNAAMLAINEALGYKVISTRTEWQLDLDGLRPSLSH